MMNKQKTSKAWRWKVATFLPLLAFLLMAFGKPGENVMIKENVPENVMKSSEVIQENQNQLSSRLIEIRKDGNYIDNKLCTLEEIVTTGKAWGKASNDWIHLRIDESIPYNRIDEILEQLEPGMYHITQSTVNSDDIIYFAGDVSERAKFTQGKWDDWIGNQLKHFSEGKPIGWEYQIAYSFIIDKNGKVRDGHITKGCDYPEINAAYEKILTQIPDWKPARRGGKAVSVLFHEIWSHIEYSPPLTPTVQNKIIAPPPPPPNKDKHQIWLRNDGKVTYNQVETTIDELAETVKSELQKNSKLQFAILIEEGKIDERVDQIKDILKDNGNPKVSFSSFHVEKRGKDSKGIYSSVWSQKPMDIK